MREPSYSGSDTLDDRSPTLLQRRVPQIVGLYLAGSYTVFEMAQWIVKRFELARVYEDLSLFGLLSFLPAVVLLAWGHGAPGRDRWSRAEKICLPVNLLVTAGLLALIWSAQTPAKAKLAAASPKPAPAVAVEADAAIPSLPSGFAKSRATVLAAPFRNNERDPANDWMAHAIPLVLEMDLSQEPRVTVHALASGGFGEVLRKASYHGDANMPLSLMLQVAQDSQFDQFLTGSFSVQDGAVAIELRLYESGKGTLMSSLSGSGPTLMAAVDELSVLVKTSLGLSPEEMAEEPDLPAEEAATTSLLALREFVLANVEENFKNDFDASMAHMDAALALDGTFAYAHLRRATFMLAHNKFDGLGEAMQSALQHSYRLSASSRFVARVIQLWLIDKKPGEALIAIEQFIAHSPRPVMARQMQLSIKAQLGDLAGAISSLEALQELESKPAYAVAHASLLVALGRLVEARAEYTEYVKNYPKDHQGYLGLAQTLQTLGQHDAALDAYQKAVAIAPSNPKLLLYLASQLDDTGNYEQALLHLKEAFRYSQTSVEKARALRVRSSFYQHHGQLALALSTLEEAWQLSEATSTGDEMLAKRMQSAWIFAKAGRSEEALALAAAAKPSMTVDANGMMALQFYTAALPLYLELGDLDKAQHASDEVRRIASSYGYREELMAASHARLLGKLGKHRQAVAAYEAFLKESPNEIEMQVDVGTEELALGELESALKRATSLLAIQPANPEAHLLAAKVKFKQGDIKQAKKHAEEALKGWALADENFSELIETKALHAALVAPPRP